MTFSIVARDPDTGAVGVCQGTGSIALASRCPHVVGEVAVTSQWHSDWRIGMRALELGRTGLAPELILAGLAQTDPLFRYRQVGIVLDDGRVAAHTGDYVESGRYAGHRLGDGYVVIGNGLIGPAVLEAMGDAFEGTRGGLFEERLLRALDAGLDAGGEGRRHVSSSIITAVRGQRRPRLDLRVDFAPDEIDAIVDLRRIATVYIPLMDYYSDYWLDHPEVDAEEWMSLTGRGHSH